MVNVGPGPTGLWDSKAVAVLEKMASWMAVNAEAVHGCAPVFPHQALAKVHTQCTDDAAVAKRVASLRGDSSSGGYFYTHDEMVTTMVQKVKTAADRQTVLYFRIAFSDKSSAKGNVITSLRGIDEITPGCRSGRTVIRFPFVKDTLLRGLSVANVTLLGGAVGGVLWNMSEAGLNLDLDATSRMFGARLFGPSNLPVVFKVSFETDDDEAAGPNDLGGQQNVDDEEAARGPGDRHGPVGADLLWKTDDESSGVLPVLPPVVYAT